MRAVEIEETVLKVVPVAGVSVRAAIGDACSLAVQARARVRLRFRGWPGAVEIEPGDSEELVSKKVAANGY